jgi:hypothetical protein
MFNGPVFNNEVVQANSRAVNNAGFSESLDEANSLYSRLTGASFELVPSSYKGGVVYSGVPNTGNGDITWTRGSDAWRTNSNGLVQRAPWNLLTWSEDFTNTSWGKSNVTVTSNSITAPNGTLTADTIIETTGTGGHFVNKPSLGLPSGGYSITIYAKAKERSKLMIFYGGTINKGYGFDLANGTTSAVTGTTSADSYSITNVGDGWYRCQVGIASSTLTGVEVYVLQSFSAFSYTGDGTSGLYLWGSQVNEGSSALPYFPTTDRLNVPRLSYMYGSAPALLLEPQRTNLFFNSGWIGGGATPTNWGAFITGTTTAVTSIKNNSVSAYRFSGTSQRSFFIYSIPVTSGVTYAISVYVESVTTTGDVGFMLSFVNIAGSVTYFRNGVSITGSTTVESGYTYTMLFVPSATASAEIRIGMGAQGNATTNYVLSMPQMEIGAYPTTFILSPTGASATRLVDAFNRYSIYTNGLITAAGGTWFTELRGNLNLTGDGGGDFIVLSDQLSTTGNAFRFYNPPSLSRMMIYKIVASIGTPLYTTTTDTVKVAIKWNGVTADVFVNGVKVVSATSFTTTNMQNLVTGITAVPRFIQQMALFPTPLSDDQCVALTSDFTEGESVIGSYERYVNSNGGAVENLNTITNLIQNLK